MGGNCGRDHPQSAQQLRTIPQSRRSRDSSLYTREPLGTGGYGLPRRFAPRNDSPDPLSFRGGPTGRRGNPSFLRWTGVRAAVPRAWPPPTKFRNEIWGVGQVVGPYGKPDQPPKPAGAQRSVRARVGEGWAGIGAKAIPKGGPPPRPPRQRLAKRKARKEQLVKFRFCPTTSECSTAYWVRKSDESPARAHADVTSTEQNRLEPHPVVQEDAERPGCTTRTHFFFRRLHRHFLFGAQKRKWGWIDAGHHPQPCPIRGSRGSGTPSRRALRTHCG